MNILKEIFRFRQFLTWLVFSCSLLVVCLHFHPLPSIESTLKNLSFGAGNRSSTLIVAFATGNPWWHRYSPEGVIIQEDGLLQPRVEIPRQSLQLSLRCASLNPISDKDIEYNSTQGLLSKNKNLNSILACQGKDILPYRDIGYYIFLGFITFLNSLRSSNIILDFARILHIQEAIYLGSIFLGTISLFVCFRDKKKSSMLLFLLATILVYSWIGKFQPELFTLGIIDSTLAPTIMILTVFLYVRFNQLVALSANTKINLSLTLKVLLIGIILSMLSMIRAEFFYINFISICSFYFINLKYTKNLGLYSILLSGLILFPVSYGLINLKLFGHFIPFRIGIGPNLIEPIGQFPNPWGIKYDDIWLIAQLSSHKLHYWSPLTDSYLSQQYWHFVLQNPVLFFSNFYQRLVIMGQVFYWPHLATLLPLTFILLYVWSRDNEQARILFIIYIPALVMLLWFAWFNLLVRVYAPAHYVLNFVVIGIIYLLLKKLLAIFQANTH